MKGLADLGVYGGRHPDGRPFAADEYPIVRALRTGEIVRGEALRYRWPDGRLADLEVHAGPVRGPDGSIVASVGMAFDVSARAEAERRLRDSEAEHRAVAERLRAAIDAGAFGLWEFDLTTQRIQLDATMAAMLGLPPRPVEIAHQDMLNFAAPEDQSFVRDVLAGAAAPGGLYGDELRLRTPANAERWFVARGVVLPDVRKVVGVMRDVTARRQREEALQAALHARDVLMHEADHRIKNSLQLVVSLLRLQASRIADSDARAALEAAIARVNAIAEAHLALQRSPDLRSVEIDCILEDLSSRVALLNPMVSLRCNSAVGLSLDVEQAIPLSLIASELLTNALRHAFPLGSSGDVLLATRVEHATLTLIVADDGAGLPEKPYRSGLGTSVIAALARQIGAAMTTRSQPGNGTTVTVSMPVPEPAAITPLPSRAHPS